MDLRLCSIKDVAFNHFNINTADCRPNIANTRESYVRDEVYSSYVYTHENKSLAPVAWIIVLSNYYFDN
jgi:hypothetical protein